MLRFLLKPQCSEANRPFGSKTLISRLFTILSIPQRWEAADAAIKFSSDENTEPKGSPFKAWSGSAYRHACTLTARDFFLANFYPFGTFTCNFFKTSLKFFLC